MEFKKLGTLYGFNFITGCYEFNEKMANKIEETIDEANDLIECISTLDFDGLDSDDEEEIDYFFEENYQNRLDTIHEQIENITHDFFGKAIDEVKYRTIVATGAKLKMYKIPHYTIIDEEEET